VGHALCSWFVQSSLWSHRKLQEQYCCWASIVFVIVSSIILPTVWTTPQCKLISSNLLSAIQCRITWACTHWIWWGMYWTTHNLPHYVLLSAVIFALSCKRQLHGYILDFCWKVRKFYCLQEPFTPQKKPL
jgi:hypothetical protein